MAELTLDEAASLNNDNPANQNAKLGTKVKKALRGTIIKGTYDFSEQGGAQGDFNLKDEEGNDLILKGDAIIHKITTDEETAFTSGGAATIVIKAGATSLTAALAFDTAFTGIDDQAFAGAVDGIKISGDQNILITVGAADLTAGKTHFYLHIAEV